jgi:hypothetical protein
MLVILTLMTTVVVNAETTPNQDGDLTMVVVPDSHMECVMDQKTLTKNLQKLELANQKLVFRLETAENNSARCQTELDKVNWHNKVVIAALVAMIIMAVFAWYKYITQAGPSIQNNNFVSTTTPNAEHVQKMNEMQGEMDAMREEVKASKSQVEAKNAIIAQKEAMIKSMATVAEMNKKKIGDLDNEIKVYHITIDDLKRHHASVNDRMMALEVQNQTDKMESATQVEQRVQSALGQAKYASDAHIQQLRHTQEVMTQEFLSEKAQLQKALDDANHQVNQLQTEVHIRDSLLQEEKSWREMNLYRDQSDHRQDNRQVNVYDQRSYVVMGAAGGKVNGSTPAPVLSDPWVEQPVTTPQSGLFALEPQTSQLMHGEHQGSVVHSFGPTASDTVERTHCQQIMGE